MSRVLHITNWYPNPLAPTAAPFVREQFLALAGQPPRMTHDLVHLNVRPGPGLPRLIHARTSANERHVILTGPFEHPRLQETLLLLMMIALRMRLALTGPRPDLVHLHIAWPLLRYPRVIRALWRCPVILSEHWSAYRSFFNLVPDSPGHKRLQKMFDVPARVIVVSRALGRDIANFTGRDDLDIRVVPNVVDPGVFYPASEGQPKGGQTGLMVATWAPIKRPLLVLGALAALRDSHPDLALRIVGDGPQLGAMQAFVRDNDLGARVTFLGRLTKPEIAQEMRRADFFAHGSEYETFSVVCAEALCCGLPLVASDVGGIPEFVNAGNGLLVANTPAAWTAGLAQIATTATGDPAAIATQAAARFNPAAVGADLAGCYEGLL